ncbi:MAG TPA: hypothetical protein VFA75_11030 [Nevskia sp.]|jgi:hypothetical protein|nr:hypothetical protein [Nevskia sp.]
MRRGYKLAFAILAFGAAGAAQAFNISAKSENPMIGQDGLRSATQQMASQVGSRIPDNADVKVTVFSRAQPSKIGQNQYIYLHRIELRRAFNAMSPPYPFAGWLPIETVERYGVGDDKEVRDELDHVLNEFFTKVKAIDPNVGIK